MELEENLYSKIDKTEENSEQTLRFDFKFYREQISWSYNTRMVKNKLFRKATSREQKSDYSGKSNFGN